MAKPYGSFGYQQQGARYYEPEDQIESLKVLGELTQRSSISPLIRNTAMKIVRDCGSRDDYCELEAIYNAVKYGDKDVPPLKNGFKYVADPRYADYFTSPEDTLNACMKGACGGDCDDHVALVCALTASLGWKSGLRAWGRLNDSGYSHVYPVVLFPKRPTWNKVVALDTTVPEFGAGDEPPKGNVLTAWLA